jgi:hypothetical protein
VSTAEPAVRPPRVPGPPPSSMVRRMTSVLPTWGLVTTKNLELRRRRGLMIAVLVLVLALPVLVLGLRLLFHAFDPSHYGPAGSPSIFQALINPMAEFGFIIAATLGAAAGTTDLTDGVFRHLVITGRSRLALFLARIPAGLVILLPLVALAFAMVCLVTNFEGARQPSSVTVNGVTLPLHLDQSQLQRWLDQHPREARTAFESGPVAVTAGTHSKLATAYSVYTSNEAANLDPPVNQMVKIGLWLELVVGIGFMVGLGFGALTGQRTVATIVLIAFEVIVTPILAGHVIPYFVNGQRLVVGVALDQLRPAGLATGQGGGGGPGHVIFGGRAALSIPPMPTWAMLLVIVGWVVGWSAIGAWRMATRDA